MPANNSLDFTSLEKTSLTGELATELNKWTETGSALGSFGARTIGFITTPLTCLIDTVVHATLFTGKVLTSLVVSPYNAIAGCIDKRYMAPIDLELSSALVHLAKAVESIFHAAILPFVYLLSPDRGYFLSQQTPLAQLLILEKNIERNVEATKQLFRSTQAEHEAKVAELEKKIEENTTLLETYKKEIAETKSDKIKWNSKCIKKIVQLDQAKKELDEAQKALTELQPKNTTKSETTTAEAKLDQVIEGFDKLISNNQQLEKQHNTDVEIINSLKETLENTQKLVAEKEKQQQANTILIAKLEESKKYNVLVVESLNNEKKELEALVSGKDLTHSDFINLKVELEKQNNEKESEINALKELQQIYVEEIESLKSSLKSNLNILEAEINIQKAASKKSEELLQEATEALNSNLLKFDTEHNSDLKTIAQLTAKAETLSMEIEKDKENLLNLQNGQATDTLLIQQLKKEKTELEQKYAALEKQLQSAEAPQEKPIVTLLKPSTVEKTSEIVAPLIIKEASEIVKEQTQDVPENFVQNKKSLLGQLTTQGFKLKSTKTSEDTATSNKADTGDSKPVQTPVVATTVTKDDLSSKKVSEIVTEQTQDVPQNIVQNKKSLLGQLTNEGFKLKSTKAPEIEDSKKVQTPVVVTTATNVDTSTKKAFELIQEQTKDVPQHMVQNKNSILNQITAQAVKLKSTKKPDVIVTPTPLDLPTIVIDAPFNEATEEANQKLDALLQNLNKVGKESTLETNELDNLFSSYVEDKTAALTESKQQDMDQKLEKLQKVVVEQKLSLFEQIKGGNFKLKSSNQTVTLKSKHHALLNSQQGQNPYFLSKVFSTIEDFIESTKDSQEDGSVDWMTQSFVQPAEDFFKSTIGDFQQKDTDEEKLEFLVSKLGYFEEVLKEIQKIKAKAAEKNISNTISTQEHFKKVAEQQQIQAAEELAKKREALEKAIPFNFKPVEDGVKKIQWQLFLQKNNFGTPVEVKELYEEVIQWCQTGSLDEQSMISKHATVKEIMTHHENMWK